VVGIAWSNDPESYTGGTIATGRVSQAGQVKGDDPDKERYPGPQGWGLSVGLTALPRKKPTSYGYFTTAMWSRRPRPWAVVPTRRRRRIYRVKETLKMETNRFLKTQNTTSPPKCNIFRAYYITAV
jgi:hypothetical protein